MAETVSGIVIPTFFHHAASGTGGLVMEETPAPVTFPQHSEIYRFYFAADGIVVGGMDLDAPPVEIAGGTGSLTVTGASGWMAGLPAAVDGAAGGTSSAGWDLTITPFAGT